ncbi:MAG: CHAD domain-containing protein [Fimbriimonas sp.]
MGLKDAGATEVQGYVRRLIDTQRREMERLEPGVRQADPDAVHDMRVAVRRLRTMMRAFAGVLPREIVEAEADARWLGRVLGEARDRDVQAEALREEAQRDPDLEPLTGAVLRERRALQANVAEALDSPRYRRFLTALATPIPASRGVALTDLAHRAERTTRKQVARSADALDKDSPATDFHRLRKRAKRLRYVLEAVEPVLGGRTDRKIKRLKRLQDEVGERQDVVTMTETVQRLLHDPDLPREAAKAGERLLARMERHETKSRRRILRHLDF